MKHIGKEEASMNNYQYGYPAYSYYPYRNVPAMAYAMIQEGPLAPKINGYVFFREVPNGVEVFIEVHGLPQYQKGTANKKPIGPHGFHLHEKGVCEIGDKADPFQSAGGHWNPTNQPHGNHAGDFPVLFSNDGYGKMTFFTNKFKVDDVIGKGVIIHQHPDDYQSQPSGDAGKRLACGVIMKYGV
jgi:superoxide dismutase, Cu-Zn family